MKVKNLRILVVLLWKWRKHLLMWMQPGNVYVIYILNVIVLPLGSENKTFVSLSSHINSRHRHLFLLVHHWFRSTRDWSPYTFVLSSSFQLSASEAGIYSCPGYVLLKLSKMLVLKLPAVMVFAFWCLYY